MTKMQCEYCELAEREEKLIYQDNEVVVAVKDSGLSAGQVTVFPKKHYTIMEMVPDEVLKKCSLIANKVSIAVFEGLGSQGTNILVQNGTSAGQKVPHFALEIIPRQENDGLSLQWPPLQLMEDEIEAAYLALKKEAEKPEAKEEGKKPGKGVVVIGEGGKENYLLKPLKRMP